MNPEDEVSGAGRADRGEGDDRRDRLGHAAGPLGAFIREQRQLARLSLREMARLTKVSNAYLSQVERGLHEPSMRVIRAVAGALDVPVEDMVNLGGPSPETEGTTAASRAETPTLEQAIRSESRLTAAQKDALLAVLRGFVGDEPTRG